MTDVYVSLNNNLGCVGGEENRERTEGLRQIRNGKELRLGK